MSQSHSTTRFDLSPPTGSSWRRGLRVLALAGVALLVAGAASAQYVVTLTNGTSFETRYEPQEVEWDENVLLLVTDTGNYIALQKDEVAESVSVAEARGHGYRLDTTTLFLGWSPNDLVTTDEEGNLVPTYDTGEPEPPALPDYTVNQFVDVPTAGSPNGGVPVGDF